MSTKSWPVQPKVGTVWLLLFLVNLVLSVMTPALHAETVAVSAQVGLMIMVLNFVVISVMIFGVLVYFMSQREQAFRLLSAEQNRSEALLLNILPAEIAGSLKQGHKTIAKLHEESSILFADMVNFTALSEQLTPVELLAVLNEVFTRFDKIAEQLGLEKIKTIGDCYMVAAGVPSPREDHAVALVKMAQEMIRCTEGMEVKGHRVGFRIGIHSGPVVAGVIGQKKYIYDLWGDTVNTASRMESHGISGAIQITERTYEAVKHRFACVAKGSITVKGKGDMRVWHVKAAIQQV